MTAQSLQSGVTVYDDSIKSEECHFPPLPFPLNFPFFFGPRFNFRATTHDHAEIFIDTYSAIRCVYAYTAISRNVFGKSARDNPERYNCGWFLGYYSSEKFERMAREAMDVGLRVLNESNKSRFDS